MYQAQVAGKPRLSGARAALEALGVPDAERQAGAYAERKHDENLMKAKAGATLFSARSPPGDEDAG
jgi:beta-phosphoglucomutase